MKKKPEKQPISDIKSVEISFDGKSRTFESLEEFQRHCKQVIRDTKSKRKERGGKP